MAEFDRQAAIAWLRDEAEFWREPFESDRFTAIAGMLEASQWQPIETAPKDGTKVDLWAKAWLPAFDRFEFRRFADCCWMRGDTMCNRSPYWLNLDKEWSPTHWMPLPSPPTQKPS